MKDVTAVIISFLRPEYTTECVRSLREQYQDIKILVAENGRYDKKLAQFVHEQDGHYFLMPYDSGVCYARNRLMELVRTRYVLVGDDDFFYDKDARVDDMKIFLEKHIEADLIGGRVRENGVVKNYQGKIHREDDGFRYEAIDPDSEFPVDCGIRYAKTDITFNYFLARTERVRDIPWDEKIKVAYEHSDWFISLKQAYREVYFTPDAVVVHKPEHVQVKDIGRYKVYRYRRTDKVHFYKKHRIKWSVGFNGVKTVYEESKKPQKNFAKKEEKIEARAYTADTSFSWNGRSYNAGEIVFTDRPEKFMRPVDKLTKGQK